jgi:ribonuclease BN (tRNA processing enzyme)
MTLIPLPAFADNYIWMLQDGASAIVVDPGDAKPVFDALARNKLKLAAILVTHHHADHVGGVDELRGATGAQVFGPAGERVLCPRIHTRKPAICARRGTRQRCADSVPGALGVAAHARCSHLAFAHGHRALHQPLSSQPRDFVRAALQAHAGLAPQSADADAFAALRQWKNNFK